MSRILRDFSLEIGVYRPDDAHERSNLVDRSDFIGHLVTFVGNIVLFAKETLARDINNRRGLKKISSSTNRLSWGTKFTFGSGAMAEAIYHGMFNTFITIYYNQVIGLSNTLIGIAVMLAIIGDAITDPVVGIVSDRWHSRHGRRHPFLFVAPVPLAVTIYFIFNPPAGMTGDFAESSQIALFAWLCAWTVLSRAFLTLYSVPHLALGGELSKDQVQRAQLFSANTIISYVSGASFAFVAWSYFLAGRYTRESDGEVVPGHLYADAYGPLVFTACALVIIAIWFCAAGTYKHIAHLSEAAPKQKGLTVGRFFKQILITLENRNYIVLIIGYFFFMIASGIYDTLNVFVNTYYWELEPTEIRWIGLTMAPAAMVGAFCSPVLMKRFDRKPVMLVALFGVALFAQLVVDLRLVGWMPANGDPMLLPALVANAVGFFFSIGVGVVAVMSMIGDVVDENELATGKREEGLYYSARAFFAKAAYSFGHFFAGVALDVFVHLPFDAVPGQLDADVLVRLGITAGPIMSIAAVFSLLSYSGYKLNRKRHKAILQGLEARQTSQLEKSAAV